MRLSNKIILIWLAVMWVVFSAWLLALTQFPLNFGVGGLESIAGIVLIWIMLPNREV